jgi:uncharacterized protein YaaN involved in tellurite resistance
MSNDDQLTQTTRSLLNAEHGLRLLSAQVKSYPDAAKRLNEVCDSLQTVTQGVESVAKAISRQEAQLSDLNRTFSELKLVLAEQVKVLRQQDLRVAALEATYAEISVTQKGQCILLTKVANRKGLVF